MWQTWITSNVIVTKRALMGQSNTRDLTSHVSERWTTSCAWSERDQCTRWEQRPPQICKCPQFVSKNITRKVALEIDRCFRSYDHPPLFDVTVDEFETTAIERLRVLAEIESSLARNRTWEELKAITYTQYMKYVPLHTSTFADAEEERRKDHLGHYVLRLAFCRS